MSEHAFVKVQDALASRIGLPREEIVPEAKLVDDLELDSLEALELLTTLEDELGHKLHVQPDNVETVGDVVTIIEPLLSRDGGDRTRGGR